MLVSLLVTSVHWPGRGARTAAGRAAKAPGIDMVPARVAASPVAKSVDPRRSVRILPPLRIRSVADRSHSSNNGPMIWPKAKHRLTSRPQPGELERSEPASFGKSRWRGGAAFRGNIQVPQQSPSMGSDCFQNPPSYGPDYRRYARGSQSSKGANCDEHEPRYAGLAWFRTVTSTAAAAGAWWDPGRQHRG